MCHSYLEGSPGKCLELPKRQETIVLGCARRGDSEHHLNELQRWAWDTAISTNTRDGHETLRLLLQPPRSLCASTGHYPHLPSCKPLQPPLPGSMIQGQLPLENIQCAAGCCNDMPASATAGSPCIRTPPFPRPE